MAILSLGLIFSSPLLEKEKEHFWNIKGLRDEKRK
jgi:hypothetical protein